LVSWRPFLSPTRVFTILLSILPMSGKWNKKSRIEIDAAFFIPFAKITWQQEQQEQQRQQQVLLLLS